ncbi:hypothetical protein QWI29_22060 [Mycolicibacterium neoaurum]|uniref:hypothetical protein n=1 Tax=Mycolicibacterium neoaurum TaxID=1795 RepID=UPI00267409FA|nr:hypothetical protein [Mycolicibacterium neoaurum]MDO3402734.1 hypothetical protein [Mycolicibacterium neoaurum]
MQLAVVAVGSGYPDDSIDVVGRRLRAAGWHAVHAANEFEAVARRLAPALDVDPEIADGVPVQTLIERYEGMRLVLLSEPLTIRTLTADALGVAEAALAAPQPFSLTTIIAGRSGKRSVAGFNDTSHLALAAAGPGGKP